MEGGQTVKPPAPRPPRPPRPTAADRRYRLTHRALPLVAIALVSLLTGVVVGALHVPAERSLADRFARAWQRGDYAAMYRGISSDAQQRYSLDRFRAAYAESATTATLIGIKAGHARDPANGEVAVPMRVRTRVFGVIPATLKLPFSGSGGSAKVDWSPRLTYPGLAQGEQLGRQTQLPDRGTILASDGTVLAKGADRASDNSAVSSQIVGELGPIPPDQLDRLRALGVPDDATVGISGLEKALQPQLIGKPGGTLSAGRRVLARSAPRQASPTRSTINPKLEAAAINALGGQDGGLAVLRPDTGAVLALAGVAYSAVGPPGSTFKIITTTAALEAHAVKLSDQFPIETGAILSGVKLSNASGESCGGTFVNAFAVSCNGVFAPLGVKVGKERLVATAEKYGYNEQPLIDGAVTSTIPPPSGIGDDLDLGSTAIGQGKVQASALQMTSIAATVGNRGVRVRPHLLATARPERVRVTSRHTAATLRHLMVAVVKFGTGVNAQIGGVTVAGKTGTAELGNNIPTDAWFVSFAPARHPRIAAGAVILGGGAGGDAAAPVVRQVLATALGKG